MKAIGYIRCSTDEQAASGLGLDAQRAAIQEAAAKLGAEVVSIHEDAGVSGAAEIADRPGLLAAVTELVKGDVLIVGKRDRLGRDPMIVGLAERLIERRGCRVVSAAGEGTDGTDPSYVLLRRMVDAFAEYERLMIGARTKAALAQARGRGIRLGRPRFGERAAGKHVREEVPEQMDIVREIVALHAAGETARGIARRLNERGIATVQGKLWTHMQVLKVVQFYGGRVEGGGKVGVA